MSGTGSWNPARLAPEGAADSIAPRIPNVSAVVSAERLSLFCRVMQKGTDHLLMAVAAATSDRSEIGRNRCWINAVQHDLKVVSALFGCLRGLRERNFPQTCQTISSDPGRFKRIFRKCLHLECVDPYCDLSEGGCSKYRKVNNDPYEHEGDFRCSIGDCLKCFADLRALKAHSSRAHGERGDVMQWIRRSNCHSCGLAFGTISRLTQHLSRRAPNRCLSTLQKLAVPVSNGEFQLIKDRMHEETAQLKQRGHRAHYAEKSVFRALGLRMCSW